MHVLLFFIAMLLAGAGTGLAFILSSDWLLAALAGVTGSDWGFCYLED